MKRRYFAVLFSSAVLFTVIANAQTQSAANPEPVRVLVLGTYHFGNPGLDLHNMKVEDVRTPAKQAELADLAERLAKFKPTKVAVEARPDNPDLTTKKFEGFTPETLMKDPDERAQIAFRLAHKLGHKAVYGIDEQSDTIDYFPFGKVEEFAKAHGQTALLDKLHAQVEATMKREEAAQKTTPIRKMLAQMNEPKRVESDHRDFYYALQSLGDRETQPGADLNGGWYLRNAKIFAKLTQIAKPGDRVVVVFGAGHNYWLRHFAQNTPGFVLVEVNDYLK